MSNKLEYKLLIFLFIENKETAALTDQLTCYISTYRFQDVSHHASSGALWPTVPSGDWFQFPLSLRTSLTCTWR